MVLEAWGGARTSGASPFGPLFSRKFLLAFTVEIHEEKPKVPTKMLFRGA